MKLTKQEMAIMIDHTILKANATEAEITELCREAAENALLQSALTHIMFL
ncbi:MAG: hypothetical protein ACYDG6_05955 [Thermincolia bacterium]